MPQKIHTVKVRWDDGDEEANAIKVAIGQIPTGEDMENAEVIYEYEGMIDGYEQITCKFIPKESGTYYLGFKDDTYDPYDEGWGLFIAIDDIVINTILQEGISKQSSKTSIYPNPARNLVYIDGDFIKVEIFNMLGQMIDLQKVEINSIDVSELRAGSYLLKMYDINNKMVITNITVIK